MVFSDYAKQQMLSLSREGMGCPDYTTSVASGRSARGIHKFLTRYAKTRTIARQPGSGRKTIVTEEIKAVVEALMIVDDELRPFSSTNC